MSVKPKPVPKFVPKPRTPRAKKRRTPSPKIERVKLDPEFSTFIEAVRTLAAKRHAFNPGHGCFARADVREICANLSKFDDFWYALTYRGGTELGIITGRGPWTTWEVSKMRFNARQLDQIRRNWAHEVDRRQRAAGIAVTTMGAEWQDQAVMHRAYVHYLHHHGPEHFDENGATDMRVFAWWCSRTEDERNAPILLACDSSL